MKGNEKDVRTVDKLINGKNNTYDDRNSWLAPYVDRKSKENGKKKANNEIYFSFLAPIIISNINVWNYTKTPDRGVKELEIYIDENLIFKVFFIFNFFIKYVNKFEIGLFEKISN